jgi:hypothetical protein
MWPLQRAAMAAFFKKAAACCDGCLFEESCSYDCNVLQLVL